jgi:hypothetical protein
VNGQIQPAGGRRVMSTGVGITLIAVGAILRFALAPSSPHGLNLHVVGVVLILAGVLSLLLSLLVWGPLSRRRYRQVGYDRAAAPLARQQRTYRGQPPAADDPRVYEDQPPA